MSAEVIAYGVYMTMINDIAVKRVKKKVMHKDPFSIILY